MYQQFKNQIKKTIQQFLGFGSTQQNTSERLSLTKIKKTNGHFNDDRSLTSRSQTKTPKKIQRKRSVDRFHTKQNNLQDEIKKNRLVDTEFKKTFSYQVSKQTKCQPLLIRQKTPTFQLLDHLKLVNDSQKQSKIDKIVKRLTSPNKSKKTQQNPSLIIDKKFESLAQRLKDLRQKPQINIKSKTYYSKLGQYKKLSPVHKMIQKNKEKRNKFQKNKYQL